ncbi:hypothetical protein J7643_12405 [bacterium]|nr:hypothetical protein [bacterium]
MVSRLLASTLVGTLLLAGCMTLPLGSLLGQANGTVADGRAELHLQPQIQAGGLTVQATVSPYVVADVDHLVVKVFTLDGNDERPVTNKNGVALKAVVPKENLSAPIAFGNLHAATTYRIRSYAYNAAAESSASLISTDDSRSYLDVALAYDDRPTMANLKVKLIGRLFNGQATASGVVLEEGELTTDGPEGMATASPDPV